MSIAKQIAVARGLWRGVPNTAGGAPIIEGLRRGVWEHVGRLLLICSSRLPVKDKLVIG